MFHRDISKYYGIVRRVVKQVTAKTILLPRGSWTFRPRHIVRYQYLMRPHHLTCTQCVCTLLHMSCLVCPLARKTRDDDSCCPTTRSWFGIFSLVHWYIVHAPLGPNSRLNGPQGSQPNFHLDSSQDQLVIGTLQRNK